MKDKGEDQTLSLGGNAKLFLTSYRTRKNHSIASFATLFLSSVTGAFVATVTRTQATFIYFFVFGTILSLLIYVAIPILNKARGKKFFFAQYEEFFASLNSSERTAALTHFTNVLHLSIKLEKQSQFLLNIVSESFDFDKDTLKQIMKICPDRKNLGRKLNSAMEGEPPEQWLEESVVAIEQMFILLQAGLYDDEPLQSIVVPEMSRRIVEAENFALFVENCLLLEKEVLLDLKETVQFCLNILGQKERVVAPLTEQFLEHREKRRRKMHELFYQWVAAIPKFPLPLGSQ